MNITVNRNEKTPLYIQISQQIKRMIFEGSLVDGYMLPSERALAAELGVHRNTIVRAYSELKDGGLLSSCQGQGYRVTYHNIFSGMVKKPVNWESLIKEEYMRIKTDFDELFSKSYEGSIISFAGGVAAREAYPLSEMTEVFGRILTGRHDNAYFYTPYQGNKELREEIARFLDKKGIQVKCGNIQIFSENNQALDFILTLTLMPGDKVIIPEPLSPDIYRTIQLAGGIVVTVPVDENGMVCERLEPLIEQEKPRYIYVDSSFNNPTGVILSLERRKKLLEISYKYRIPIIEEDEGSELYYKGKMMPSLKSMDTGNNVIYMYSFSLTMVPGAGISFVAADKRITERLSRLISVRLVTLDWASQMLMLEYMKEGLFYSRLNTFREICRSKRDIMYEQLEIMKQRFDIEFSLPEGGVYFWIRLPDGIDAKRLLKEAQKQGVTFIPGYVFYPEKPAGNNYIRLNFSYPDREEIEPGMLKLSHAIDKMRHGKAGELMRDEV